MVLIFAALGGLVQAKSLDLSVRLKKGDEFLVRHSREIRRGGRLATLERAVSVARVVGVDSAQDGSAITRFELIPFRYQASGVSRLAARSLMGRAFREVWSRDGLHSTGGEGIFGDWTPETSALTAVSVGTPMKLPQGTLVVRSVEPSEGRTVAHVDYRYLAPRKGSYKGTTLLLDGASEDVDVATGLPIKVVCAGASGAEGAARVSQEDLYEMEPVTGSQVAPGPIAAPSAGEQAWIEAARVSASPQWREAGPKFAAAVDLLKGDSPFLASCAACAAGMSSPDLDLKLHWLRMAVSLDPTDSYSPQFLAWQLSEAGRFSESVLAARESIRRDGENHLAWHWLAYAKAGMGDYRGAIEASRALVKLDPQSSSYRMLSSSLRQFGGLLELGEALAAAKTAVRLDPEDGYAWVELAYVQESTGFMPDAIASLRRAVAVWPHDGTSWDALGDALYMVDRYQEAAAAHEKAVQFSPNDANVLTGLAQDYVEIDDEASLAEAYKLAVDALRLDPRHAWAWVCLGRIDDSRRRYAQAILDYKRALAILPKEGLIHYDLAAAYYAQDRHSPDARREAKRAMALGDRGGWLYDDLGLSGGK